jgi:hypothetical protein
MPSKTLEMVVASVRETWSQIHKSISLLEVKRNHKWRIIEDNNAEVLAEIEAMQVEEETTHF